MTEIRTRGCTRAPLGQRSPAPRCMTFAQQCGCLSTPCGSMSNCSRIVKGHKLLGQRCDVAEGLERTRLPVPSLISPLLVGKSGGQSCRYARRLRPYFIVFVGIGSLVVQRQHSPFSLPQRRISWLFMGDGVQVNGGHGSERSSTSSPQ